MVAKPSRRLGVLAVTLVLTTAACDDGTTPIPDFDPTTLSEAMERMASTTDEVGPAFSGMAAASSAWGTGESLADLVPTRGSARNIAATRRLAESGVAAYLPGAYFGVTFVWDAELGTYVPSDEAGAPADGVRIVYYAVNPISGAPALPLNALGYVELRDLSTDASNRIGIQVVSETGSSPVTLADYYLDSSFTLTQSSLEAQASALGYLSNGTDQLNVDMSNEVSISSTALAMVQDYSMDMEGTGIAVAFTATFAGDPQTELGTLDLLATLTDGTEELVLEMSADEAADAVDGEMRYQGVPVVLIGGSLETPTFTTPAGDPLTQDEINALQGLWQAVGVLFGLAAFVMVFG